VSLRFDDDARHEYLEAIRFYGRAAERFVQAVDVAIEQIRGDPDASGKLNQVSEVAVLRIRVLDSLRAG